MNYKITAPSDITEIRLKHVLEFAKYEKANEKVIMQKMIEIFCNVSSDDYKFIPLNVVDTAISNITKALEGDSQRLIVELDGVKYGRIPNLEKISAGEYTDMDDFITPVFNGETNTELVYQFMSILYRPIKGIVEVKDGQDLYSIVPYDQEYIDGDHYKVIENHMMISEYTNSVGFFLDLKTQLFNAMQTYFREAKLTGQESNLIKLSDGMEVLKHTHEAKVLAMKKPLMSILTPFYTHSPMMQVQDN